MSLVKNTGLAVGGFAGAIVVGAGITAYMGFTKLKNLFYPPTLAKYTAIGAILLSGLAVKNCGYISAEARTWYENAKQEHIFNEKKEIEEKNRRITDQSRKIIDLESIIQKGSQKASQKSTTQTVATPITVKNEAAPYKFELSDKMNSSPAPQPASVVNYSQLPQTITKLKKTFVEAECGGIFYYDKAVNKASLYKREGDVFTLVAQYKGTSGVDPSPKEREGQSSTPEQIYVATEVVMDAGHDPRCDPGFLRLNYPNAQDQQAGRTGGGVFISGTSDPARLAAIDAGKNSTHSAVSFKPNDFRDIVSKFQSYGRVPIVIENSGRPLVR
jgi:hypothetical protein